MLKQEKDIKFLHKTIFFVLFASCLGSWWDVSSTIKCKRHKKLEIRGKNFFVLVLWIRTKKSIGNFWIKINTCYAGICSYSFDE